MAHEAISVFDMFKIGVGPSSSHTLGPWRAALKCLEIIQSKHSLSVVKKIDVVLYGSLAKTGKGHGTDTAIILGLCGEDPVTINVDEIDEKINQINSTQKLLLNGIVEIDFNPFEQIEFLYNESLPFHPNGMSFLIELNYSEKLSETFYSIGGGFIIQEGEIGNEKSNTVLPFPINTSEDLLHWCMKTGFHIHEIVLENELAWNPEIKVKEGVWKIWETMKECCELLDHFEVKYNKQVVSAHRTPDVMFDYASKAVENGFKIIIAAAGGAAHLPGMVASKTTLPVIGVPIQSKTLNGIDSLLSIVQMPAGIPVATVSIGGAKNAGILAARILGAFDDRLSAKLSAFGEDLKTQVAEKNAKLKSQL